MRIDTLQCPSCGYPLPAGARVNQLLKCPACMATMLISDWDITDTNNTVAVETPTRVYTIAELLSKDDVCNAYRCTFTAEGKAWQGMFRIARDAGDNDLVQNEAKMLYHLQSAFDYPDFRPFLPAVLESFLYQDAIAAHARQANILGLHEKVDTPGEFYTLEEVRKYYQNGINPRDMAWMFRRLLNILGFVHECKTIHGAVLPSHVLIEPNEHKLVLAGWCFAVREPETTGNRLTAISTSYEAWYPPEVHAKALPTPGLDILMAARCMLYLVGADPLGDGKYPTIEPALQNFFAQCLQTAPQHRPQQAWKLLGEFDQLIETLWGPRQFREFRMPSKV